MPPLKSEPLTPSTKTSFSTTSRIVPNIDTTPVRKSPLSRAPLIPPASRRLSSQAGTPSARTSLANNERVITTSANPPPIRRQVGTSPSTYLPRNPRRESTTGSTSTAAGVQLKQQSTVSPSKSGISITRRSTASSHAATVISSSHDGAAKFRTPSRTISSSGFSRSARYSSLSSSSLNRKSSAKPIGDDQHTQQRIPSQQSGRLVSTERKSMDVASNTLPKKPTTVPFVIKPSAKQTKRASVGTRATVIQRPVTQKRASVISAPATRTVAVPIATSGAAIIEAISPATPLGQSTPSNEVRQFVEKVNVPTQPMSMANSTDSRLMDYELNAAITPESATQSRAIVGLRSNLSSEKLNEDEGVLPSSPTSGLEITDFTPSEIPLEQETPLITLKKFDAGVSSIVADVTPKKEDDIVNLNLWTISGKSVPSHKFMGATKVTSAQTSRLLQSRLDSDIRLVGGLSHPGKKRTPTGASSASHVVSQSTKQSLAEGMFRRPLTDPVDPSGEATCEYKDSSHYQKLPSVVTAPDEVERNETVFIYSSTGMPVATVATPVVNPTEISRLLRNTEDTMTANEVQLDKTAVVCTQAVLKGNHPISIGANTIIHPGVFIDADCGPIEIGDGNIIEELSVLRNRSTEVLRIGNFNLIECGTEILDGATIGNANQLEPRCIISAAASISNGCTVMSSSTVKPHAKIQPGAVVMHQIIDTTATADLSVMNFSRRQGKGIADLPPTSTSLA